MILVIGYGNTMRSDDGVGIYVADQIAAANMPHVTVMTVQQLHVELIEDALEYDKIILIDASQEGQDVSLHKIDTDKISDLVSSHHLGPQLLGELARTIYGKNLDLHLCSIRGENFSIGNQMTEAVLVRAEQALVLLRGLIKETTYA